MKTHTIELSNGKTLTIEENVERLSFITDNHFGSLIKDGFVTHNTKDCHNLVSTLGKPTCADTIFRDGDWSFAEVSSRLWAKELADSPKGKTIINLYLRYKPTLNMLNEEGANLQITKDFVAYMEDAFDASLGD
jgi:hypothetical protein